MKTYLKDFILLIAFTPLICCNSESNELNKSPNILYANQKEMKTDPSIGTVNFFPFWEQFRMAIVNSNYEELKHMTHFPLILQGYEDSDPVLSANDDSFKEIFEYYLKHQTIYYKDSSFAKMDFFKNLNSLKDFNDYFEKDSVASVEYLNFTRTSDGWKLSKIYLDTKGLNK